MSIPEAQRHAHTDVSPESADGEPWRDTVFHVLQNERRRRVIRYLSECDGPVEMREMAEQVAAREHDTTVAQLTSDERQRVYIALYQSHLPKLDEYGIIHYNQSRGIVERTELIHRVERYLDIESDVPDGEASEKEESERPRPWTRYYAGATLVSLGFAGLGWPGVSGVLSLEAATVFIVGLFGVLTVLWFVDEVAE